MNIISSIFLMVMVLNIHRKAQSATEESRHPLSPRRMAASSSIRILSFGSSTAWGREVSMTDTYPYKLNADNAAVRQGGSNLAAACTQSIVKDTSYDVVTIEFTVFDEATAILTKRIRQRFPNATIILVRLWNPGQMRYTGPDGEIIPLDEFRKQKGNLSRKSKELYLSILTSDPDRWSLSEPVDSHLVGHVIREYQAELFSLPRPQPDIFQYPQTLHTVMTLFEGESDDLSSGGHGLVTQKLQEMIAQKDIPRRADRDVTGTWGSGDHCSLWYANGLAHNVRGSSSLVEFGHTEESHKHAMEIPRAGKTIQMDNPFDAPRMLYLTYMTAGEDDFAKIYPKIRVLLDGKPTVVMDPYHDETEGPHLARTSAVGFLPARSTSSIALEPLESTRHPFRLVGASIISEEMADIPLDFVLESEPAIVSSNSFLSWS